MRWRGRSELILRTIRAAALVVPEAELAPNPRGIGDNGGPPLDPDESWRHWCWKRAVKRAWKTPGREIALRRLARAEALGISYRAYTLEVLERGVYL